MSDAKQQIRQSLRILRQSLQIIHERERRTVRMAQNSAISKKTLKQQETVTAHVDDSSDK